MRARFPGKCPRCLTAIIVGHTIRKENGRWVHLSCSRHDVMAQSRKLNRDWARMKHQFAQRENVLDQQAEEQKLFWEEMAQAEMQAELERDMAAMTEEEILQAEIDAGEARGLQ